MLPIPTISLWGSWSRRLWLSAGIFLSAFLLSCDSNPESPLGPSPTEPILPFEEAVGLFQEGRHDEAIEALRPFVSTPHPETRALVIYARALLGASRQSLAVWPLQRAMEREDAPKRVSQLYVSALVYGGAEREAIAEATRLLEEDPENRPIRELRVRAYEATLDLESAVEDMEILVAETPDEARRVEMLLNLLIKIEDWDSARERIIDLRRLLERDGVKDEARAVFCATAARFEKDRGNIEESEEALRGCLEQYPTDPNVLFSLEELLDETGRVDEATELLEARSSEYPGRPLIRQGLAARYVRLGRQADADALLLETAQTVGQPNSWLSLANLRLSVGDLEGTVQAVDRAVGLAMGMAPDDPTLPWEKMTPDSRFGIGDVYVRAGQFDRAGRIIESLEDEPAMALLLAARVKLEQGDPEGALADYQEAFKTFPSNPAARYLAGRAALEVGDFDLGIDLYQDALRSDATATDAGLVLAQILLAEGRITYALDTLSFYLSVQPDEPHAIRLMARAGAVGGMHRFAENARARLATNLDWAGVALADQAKDIVVLRGPEAARDYLAESPELEKPTHFEAFSAWVGLAATMGEKDQARARAAELLERNPEAAGPWIVHSRLLFDDGKTDESIAAISRAIELNETIVTAHAELGEMLLTQERIDEALAAFDRASDLDTLDARAAISAAAGLYDAGRYEEAAERLQTILIHHPWHGRAALMLAEMPRDAQVIDDETAYRMAQRAARYIGVSGARTHLVLGRFELERGDAEEARALFEKAIRAKVELGTAYYGLAQSLVALERRGEAVEPLELALAQPDFDETVPAAALLEELKAAEATQ